MEESIQIDDSSWFSRASPDSCDLDVESVLRSSSWARRERFRPVLRGTKAAKSVRARRLTHTETHGVRGYDSRRKYRVWEPENRKVRGKEESVREATASRMISGRKGKATHNRKKDKSCHESKRIRCPAIA